jgi:hypothetical protein
MGILIITTYTVKLVNRMGKETKNKSIALHD